MTKRSCDRCCCRCALWARQSAIHSQGACQFQEIVESVGQLAYSVVECSQANSAVRWTRLAGLCDCGLFSVKQAAIVDKRFVRWLAEACARAERTLATEQHDHLHQVVGGIDKNGPNITNLGSTMHSTLQTT
jgi:hypothetical protein